MLKKIITSWILITFLGAFATPVSFAATPSLNQRLKQTNSRRNYFHQKKQQADLRLKTERNKLSNNQQKLEKAHQQLQATTTRYNALVSSLSRMETQLNGAIVRFRNIDAEMKERIRQVYKHQRAGMFEAILSSKNLSTMLDMFYFEKIIIKDDYRRLREVKAQADNILKMKAQVDTQRRLVEASIRDIKNQKANIQSSIAINKQMVERLQKDKNYYERSERELARQSASIQSMIANLTQKNSKNTSTQVKVSSTGFIWPISGPITSPYGYRTHPIFKRRIYHSGIDIGGPNGGSIKASNDGKVIYSGWYGGYGKVVILDHGRINGQPITTLYAHMSTILASNGQFVKKGQVIGKEGSTGYSTGPHCHFEVRINGKPTNPLSYLR